MTRSRTAAPRRLDSVTILHVPTTGWAMEQLRALAASGRYREDVAACADEILRAALRDIEAGARSRGTAGRGT